MFSEIMSGILQNVGNAAQSYGTGQLGMDTDVEKAKRIYEATKGSPEANDDQRRFELIKAIIGATGGKYGKNVLGNLGDFGNILSEYGVNLPEQRYRRRLTNTQPINEPRGSSGLTF